MQHAHDVKTLAPYKSLKVVSVVSIQTGLVTL